MRVGIAGIGRMGAAMANRLLARGQAIAVWNRTAHKADPLAAQGAWIAATPAALASACDVILTILTDAPAIEAVYDGNEGLLSGEVAGKLFVEMSTVAPEVEEALLRRVTATGARFLECPVGGSVGPAGEGKLLALVGGDAADLERARPLLEHLCRRIEHLGPVGAGARMKLAVNLPMHVYWPVLAEAMALLTPLEIDAARIVDIFGDTSGAPNSFKARAATISAALRGDDIGPAGFDIDSIRKDMRVMVAEAAAAGVTLPVTNRSLARYDEAASDGLGSEGGAVLLRGKR